MSNKQKTLNAFIEHLNAGNITAFGDLLADEGFNHQFYPKSLNMPLRNKSEFLQEMHSVKSFIASFNVCLSPSHKSLHSNIDRFRSQPKYSKDPIL
jgi:hypothetical protein